MGFFKVSSTPSGDDELPAVLQEKSADDLVKGRRTSVVSDFIQPDVQSEEFEEWEECSQDEPVYNLFPERSFAIRFDEFDEVQATIHINDYTNSEIKKAWYKGSDYDKMIQSAQKTVRKVEELGEGSRSKSNKKNVVVNSRGLENWTAAGSVKARRLKDSAVQAVWSEQSEQWEEGTFEPDKIREAYLPFSVGAHEMAHERGKSDAAVHEKALRKQKEKAEQGILTQGLSQSKKAIGKSMKFGVKTTKSIGEASLYTGKVAVKRTRRVSVGVATLDAKMLKEALKFSQEETVVRPTRPTRQPSQSKIEIHDEDLKSLNSLGSFDTHSEATPTVEEKKKERLKLLGVVPIPGTTRRYNEDIENEKREKRKARTQMPRWESSRKMSGKV